MRCAWSLELRSITSSARAALASSSMPQRSILAQPSIAVSGVRSSWETIARNRSFARFAASSSRRDSSRARTTCSYARISRRMPIAPATRPPVLRSADALRVVGITSPDALRGLRRMLRVIPRSTTSRNAATNSRVSSGPMNRDSDCSTTCSSRKPRSSETASFAWRILPCRSLTNTGSGASLMRLSAYRQALSSSRMSRRIPMTPLTSPPIARRADAFKVVGMISPEALRGWRRAFRVAPRSTTSRRAVMKSRVSSTEMMRDSDCSINSSGRKPNRLNTASFA